MTENHQPQNEIENPQTLQERRLAFGEILRSARNNSGCSINELSQSTRISRDFLIALEEGRFELLPGAIFARGFIRSLCKSLGIEAAPLVEAFDAAMGAIPVKTGGLQVPNGQRDVQAGLKKKRSASGRRGFAISSVDPRILATAGIAILICFGALVYSLQPDKGGSLKSVAENKTAKEGASENRRASTKPAPAVDVSSDPLTGIVPDGVGADPVVATSKPSAPVVSSSEPAKSVSVTSGNAGGQPTASGAQVIQLVVKETVKVRVKVDKAEQTTMDLKPDTYTYEFHDKADFMIYDAGSAELLFNGKSIGSLGSKGRIRRLSFRASEPDAKKM